MLFISSHLVHRGREEAAYVLHEIHEGVCSNHYEGLVLAQKVIM